MAPKPLPSILGVEPYKGGDSVIPGVARPIKLASNENPLGASPKAQAAYADATARLHLYPDPTARALREAIGARYGLDPQRIVCGAGSDEIFQLLIRAYVAPGDEVVQTAHGFSIYRIFSTQAGARVLAAAEHNLTADVDAILALVGPKTRVVFLANPNNPTGTYLPADEVRRLHAGLPGDVLLVLDAAYAEYVRRNDYVAGVELAGECDNVLMTRTFSKIHGLAGARVGWAFGPQAVIDNLNRVRGPFNVAAAAQAAAAAAVADHDWVEASVAHNAAELDRVVAGLAAIGLTTTPSVCNFTLIQFPDADGRRPADAEAFMRGRGVIPRSVAGYGLAQHLRLSIGTRAENDAALAALAAFMETA